MLIRFMRSDDTPVVQLLLMCYLKETYDGGGDFPPTMENAEAFANIALEGAGLQDPCLVATDGPQGAIVGFVIARGIDTGGMTTRCKTIRSWGTYVVPEFRTKGVAVSLFITAGRIARIAGYDRFIGMTHGSEYENHAMGVVNRIPGMVEIGKVLMMDLSRKKKEQAVA